MNQKPKKKCQATKKTNDIVMKDPTGMVQIFLRLPIFSISNNHLYESCCCRHHRRQFKTINPNRFQNCCIAITYELSRTVN